MPKTSQSFYEELQREMEYNLPEHWGKELDNHKIIGLVSTDLSKASNMLLFSNCGSMELMRKN